jgi:hypothetical protein
MNHPKRTRRELQGSVLGMIMGDGSLFRNYNSMKQPTGHYKLSISHSSKQTDYLKYKMNIVQDMFSYPLECRNRIVKSSNNKTYPVVRFDTRISSRLSFLQRLTYLNGKKRILPEMLNRLTIEGLAYWFLDDGCLYSRIRGSTEGLEQTVIFCLASFPEEDVLLFRDWLIWKYDIHFNIAKISGNRGLELRRGISEGHKLLNLVEQYTCPSMEYKVRYVLPKKIFPVATPIEITVPTVLFS